MKFESGVIDVLKIKNKSVTGIKFNHYITAAVANTANANAPVDWSKIHVDIDVNQDGKVVSIFSGKLAILINAATFGSQDFSYLAPVSGSLNKKLVTLANGVGVKEKAQNGFWFYFGDIINLKGGDSIEVSVDMDSDVYESNSDSSASWMDVQEIEGVGRQISIPQWKWKPITDNDESPQFHLGNNVLDVTIVNLDKSSILKSDAIVDKVTLQSDKLYLKEEFEDLLTLRDTQFPYGVNPSSIGQTFKIVKMDGTGTDLDDVKVEIEINDLNNVSASKNYLVWKTYYTSDNIIIRNQNLYEKHTKKNIAKLQAGPKMKAQLKFN